MKRDMRLYLDDISGAIDKILNYTGGMGFEQFKNDGKTVDAVIRNFEVIGEAAKNIPDNLAAAYPDVPWKEMAGMRDKLSHEYFGVRLDVVWHTVQGRLPGLRSRIQEIIGELDVS